MGGNKKMEKNGKIEKEEYKFYDENKN